MVAKKPVNVRLWPDLWERAQRLAERKGRPVTWIVERALEEYCQREETGESLSTDQNPA